MKLQSIIGLGAIGLLSACGFHLRGTDTASQQPLPYSQFATVANHGVMQEDMQNAIARQSGMQLVPVADAKGVIEITSVSTDRVSSAVNLSGSTIEYLLTLRIEGKLMQNGKAVGDEPMVVVVRRHMDYANTEVLGKNDEQEQLWADMRADAADKMLRQVRSRLLMQPTTASTIK